MSEVRKKPPGDKRDRILNAAVKVFAEHGFHATRVSDVAREAGVADGTIYLYFENKESLLTSIFEDRITALIDTIEERVARGGGAEEHLREVVSVQLGLLEEHRDLAEVLTVNLRQSSKLMRQYAAPLFNRYLDVIASIVARGQQDGVFRSDLSPRIVARSIWGALDGLALTWALGSPESTAESLRRAAAAAATLFLKGLQTER